MTEEEIEAVAAEPDGPAVDDLGGGSSVVDAPLFVGPCIGGPWDGLTGTSRFPKGFLLVHRPLKQAWVYDFMGGEFHARTERAEALSDEGRMRAAMESTYDIRVVDA